MFKTPAPVERKGRVGIGNDHASLECHVSGVKWLVIDVS